jgi:hypothetical protein
MIRNDRNLIPLQPNPVEPGLCPVCRSSEVTTERTLFLGTNIMGEHACGSCGYAFLRDLPCGFAIDFPITMGLDGKLFDPELLPGYVGPPFLKGFHERNVHAVKIERRVFRPAKNIVVLNTLDFLYGHVLLRMYNALDLIDRYPDLGVVMLVPRMYEWLIPEGLAEAWIVDLRLGQIQGWHDGIDAFVQERLSDHEEVYLAKGYSHPDVAGRDLARFTKVEAMPESGFKELPPHITFVARTDRLWSRWPLMRFLHRASKHPLLRWLLRPIVLGDQERLIRGTMRHIRKSIPEASFSVVGLAPARMNSAGVNDLRTERMSTDVELEWCRAYGRSQVVVGVHGSNMLLPTALAGACVEILPYDRSRNLAQDISVRYSGRAQLFHYRFIGEFSTPWQVARHVVSIFQDRDEFMRNNYTNVF